MILENFRAARFALLEDSPDVNMLPLIVDALSHISKDIKIIILCYDQPAATWQNIMTRSDIQYYENNHLNILANISSKSFILIDSFNQMSLSAGSQKSFVVLQTLMLNPMVVKIVTIFHIDCIQKSSKTLIQLEHMVHTVLTPQQSPDDSKLRVTMKTKRAGKLVKSTEDIWYDSEHGCLRSAPVSKRQPWLKETEEVLPHTLTTFKIGLEDKEKLARDELELPYLKKSETGKVYYEHDAADDWDDEDPDDDLDV